MVLEITNPERDLLFELIESAHREMIQEIDHTDTRDFRKLCRISSTCWSALGRKSGQHIRNRRFIESFNRLSRIRVSGYSRFHRGSRGCTSSRRSRLEK